MFVFKASFYIMNASFLFFYWCIAYLYTPISAASYWSYCAKILLFILILILVDPLEAEAAILFILIGLISLESNVLIWLSVNFIDLSGD